MEEKVDNFLLLHDTLTKGNYEFVTTNPYTQLVSCKLSISEFHRRTKAAFDFKFVADNCEFVLDHLKNNIDPEKSIKFLASIVVLGDIKKRDFLMLFPTLRSYYRKDDTKLENDGKMRTTKFHFIFDFFVSFSSFQILKKLLSQHACLLCHTICPFIAVDASTQNPIGKRFDFRQESSIASETDDRKKMKKSYKESVESYDDLGSTIIDKSIIRNPEKRLNSDSFDNNSPSVAKNYKRMTNAKNTTVQWQDAIPNGKLFTKYDVDYEEIPEKESASKILDIRSIFKN